MTLDTQKTTKYFCFVETDGENVLLSGAKKLTKLNQFKKTWQRVNSRELARELNKQVLVIK